MGSEIQREKVGNKLSLDLSSRILYNPIRIN